MLAAVSDRPPFQYSAISQRPKLELPDGKKLAVVIAVNVEYYAWGQPALSLAQFTAQLVPDPLNYSWREYGARVGVFRLMEILDRFEIPVTAPINSQACDQYPAIVEEGKARNWCWVGHGANNSEWIVGMEADAERAVLQQITESVEAAAGTRPRGWLGPALTESPHTNALLAELGYTYTLNWGIDDEPVRLEVADRNFLAVPYASEFNDIPVLSMQGQSGADWARALTDQFDQLLAEGADRPRVMSFGVHPFLTGQPYRAKHFASALEHMTRHRDEVWFTTSDAVADWYLEQGRDV
jgi:peptidoglycan/xylan/chitin deacetylase (PgdA/CDA1 family)